MKGYIVAYEPAAKAMETSSINITEEIKRKIRISAGGLQAFWELRSLLNPLKYGILSFQYFSHQALRWTLAPISLILLFLSNGILAWQGMVIYQYIFVAHILFYIAAYVGYLFEHAQIRFKYLFIPFYFTFMNLSIFLGLAKLIRGNHSVNWEKVIRKKVENSNHA